MLNFTLVFVLVFLFFCFVVCIAARLGNGGPFYIGIVFPKPMIVLAEFSVISDFSEVCNIRILRDSNISKILGKGRLVSGWLVVEPPEGGILLLTWQFTEKHNPCAMMTRKNKEKKTIFHLGIAVVAVGRKTV